MLLSWTSETNKDQKCWKLLFYFIFSCQVYEKMRPLSTDTTQIHSEQVTAAKKFFKWRTHPITANQIFQQLVKYVYMYYRQTSKFQCFNLYIIWSAINANRRNCHTKQNIEIGIFNGTRRFRLRQRQYKLDEIDTLSCICVLCILYVQWMEKKHGIGIIWQ